MDEPVRVVDEVGTVRWYLDGELHVLHRDDGPAIEFANGTAHWYRHGKFHRVGGPAIERVNGQHEWWQRQRRHRDDGPAIVEPGGDDSWWLNGLAISAEAGTALAALSPEQRQIAANLHEHGCFISKAIQTARRLAT